MFASLIFTWPYKVNLRLEALTFLNGKSGPQVPWNIVFSNLLLACSVTEVGLIWVVVCNLEYIPVKMRESSAWLPPGELYWLVVRCGHSLSFFVLTRPSRSVQINMFNQRDYHQKMTQTAQYSMQSKGIRTLHTDFFVSLTQHSCQLLSSDIKKLGVGKLYDKQAYSVVYS